MTRIQRLSLCMIALLLVSAHSPALSAAFTGGTGPDVIGFRIGMTAEEARIVFKTNVLVTPAMQKGYREQLSTLESVPNSKLMALMAASANEPDKTNKQIYVIFGPVPGHETIVSLHRVESLLPSKRPTFDAFQKLLIEKYGTPTQTSADWPGQFWWSFDADGTVQKPGFIKNAGYCFGAQQKALDSPWVLLNVPRIPDSENLAARCGATAVLVVLNFEGQRFAGPQTLVDLYATYMVGFDAALRSYRDAAAIIDKAKADIERAKAAEGQKQRPNL